MKYKIEGDAIGLEVFFVMHLGCLIFVRTSVFCNGRRRFSPFLNRYAASIQVSFSLTLRLNSEP